MHSVSGKWRCGQENGLKNSRKRESSMGFLKKLACILGWRNEDPKEEPIDPDELCYHCGVDYSESYDDLHPYNCAVIERTADGKRIWICCLPLKEGTTCPRHGTVKEEIFCD